MNTIQKEIKAVFFDIDGTFFDHDSNQVKASSIVAVNELKKQGYKVALCSGRPLRMASELPVFEGIAWDGFIGSAGTVVYDEKLQEMKRNGFTNATLKQIFKVADDLQVALYVNGGQAYLSRKDDEVVQILSQFHVRIPEVRTFQESDQIEMISMFKGYDYDYSPFLNIPGVVLQKSSGVIMDLVKQGVHKSSGIQTLMNYWNLEHQDYLAFGDSMNDKEMLRDAKIGIAMKNGDARVFPYADAICGASYEDSIYTWLKEHSFI